MVGLAAVASTHTFLSDHGILLPRFNFDRLRNVRRLVSPWIRAGASETRVWLCCPIPRGTAPRAQTVACTDLSDGTVKLQASKASLTAAWSRRAGASGGARLDLQRFFGRLGVHVSPVVEDRTLEHSTGGNRTGALKHDSEH